MHTELLSCILTAGSVSHSQTGLRWAEGISSPHFSPPLDSYTSFPRHAAVMFPVQPVCWRPLEFSGAPEKLAYSKTDRTLPWEMHNNWGGSKRTVLWSHSEIPLEPLKQKPLRGIWQIYPSSRTAYHLMCTTHTWWGNPWARITVTMLKAPHVTSWLIMVTTEEFSDTWGHNTVKVSVKNCGSFLCRLNILEFIIRKKSPVLILDRSKELQRLNLTPFYKNNMENS